MNSPTIEGPSYEPPTIARWLLKSAVRKLPAEFAERYEMEWIAELATLRDDGAWSAALFALRVRLNVGSTAKPLAGHPSDSGSSSSDDGLISPWVADQAAASEAIRRLLERHAAPPAWADVLDAMRKETAEVDGIIDAELETSLDALSSVFEASRDELVERLRDARHNPLATPAGAWPRSRSVRQLWKVSDASELANEHLQNELNWLIDSELRRARYAFGSVELPNAMLAVLHDAGRQTAAEAVAEWQTLTTSQRPTLDTFVRSQVRHAFTLRAISSPADKAEATSAEVGNTEQQRAA